MTEKLHQSREAGQESHSHKAEATSEIYAAKQEAKIEAETKRHAELLEKSRHEVEATTETKQKTLDRLKAEQAPDDGGSAPVATLNEHLKVTAFRNEIRHIRRKLNAPDRLTSKIIHQPVIRVISDTSSKTITRPSGLLGGGLTAFIGTTSYYYFTKHIGLKYNYTIFLILFVVGFILGLFIELAIWTMNSKRRTSH